MSYSDFIARRYMRSQRNAGFVSFITAISTLGIMLGTATLIIALSILGGFEREITEKVIGFTSHLEILGFRNIPLHDPEGTMAAVRGAFPVVQSISPFVAREALIRSREGVVDGILLKGVDIRTDRSAVRRYIVEGAFDLVRDPGGMPKLVLGRRLAERLSLEVGDRATIFGISNLAEQGQPRVMQFRVTGLYESGMAEYDDVYGMTALADAQMLFQYGQAVSGFDVYLARLDSINEVALGIQDLLGYPYFGRSVFDSYRNLFSWIELQKKPAPIILGLIIIVATVNIIGTLLMMVLDRTREIGILSSLGATRGGISRIFLRQGLTIALSGTLLGNVLAFLLLYAQQTGKFLSLPSDIYFMSSVPVLMRPEYFLLVSVVAVALSLLSSLIPARLAARVDPVHAIRFT